MPFLTTQGKFSTLHHHDTCPQEYRANKSTWHRPVSLKVKHGAEKNNKIFWNVSVIPKTRHSGQAEHLAWVQESVCPLPDQIVVKGNSHMNVIRAQAQTQALIIWEKSVVWQLWRGLRLCPKRLQLTLRRRKRGESEKTLRTDMRGTWTSSGERRGEEKRGKLHV